MAKAAIPFHVFFIGDGGETYTLDVTEDAWWALALSGQIETITTSGNGNLAPYRLANHPVRRDISAVSVISVNGVSASVASASVTSPHIITFTMSANIVSGEIFSILGALS